MDYIRYCINNPVKVTVGVLLLILFGLIALFAIPIQLTPDVDQPIITVQTTWPGRSPEEVERSIIEKQEEKLKGLTNLRKMTASATLGRSEIKLEFYIGVDMTRALQEASDKLREVEEYPDDVNQPVIIAADSAVEKPITWMILTADDPAFDIQSVYDEVDKRVKPILERVEGVSQINVYGGRQREVHIAIDPRRMAERGITFNALRRALQLQNVNVSAGDLAEGRLDVRVRTVGQYDNLEAVSQTIVSYTTGGPIRVKDLGEVSLSFEKRRAFVHSKGRPAMAINAIRETGANVIAVMDGLRARVKQVNEPGGVLAAISRDITAERGLAEPLQLSLEQVYDETVYINDALALVVDNLWQGGVLAALVLLVFLRKLRPTFIIGMAIPISIIGTFVALTGAGRNLNVVSLAGLAFAVGMVVDNAIVVLENTDRHIGMGKKPAQAAYDGANEVWSAILASTLTTLIVFVPVLIMQEEAGQLFRDISLAVCAAVALSLVVAITVIPTASAKLLKPHQHRKHAWAEKADTLWGVGPSMGKINTVYSDFILRLISKPLFGSAGRFMLSAAGLLLAVVGGLMLLMFREALTPVKMMLMPVWMNLFGVVLVVSGLVVGLVLLMKLRRGSGLREKLGSLGIGVLLAVSVLMMALGLYFAIRFYALHEISLLVGAVVGFWQVWLALALVVVGLVVMQPVRAGLVMFFMIGSLVGAFLMAPPMTYLPAGNQNLVFGIMLTPPAHSMAQNEFIGERMEARLRPFWEAASYEEIAKLETVIHPFTQQPVEGVPPVENFFFVSWNGTVFYGASSKDTQNVNPLEGLLMWSGSAVPGVIPLAFQTSIFGRGLGGTNQIDVDIVGTNLEQLRLAADAMQNKLREKFGFMGVRPDPVNFNLPGPEVQVEIDRVRAADIGVNASDLGDGIQALVDGLRVGDYRYRGDTIDLLVTRDATSFELTSDGLALVPLAVVGNDGSHRILPLSSVATVKRADAPQQINRVEQQRSITLQVIVPPGQALEEAMGAIQEMIPPLRQQGQIALGVDVNLGGTADKLVEVREALTGQVHDSFWKTFQSFIQSRLFLALLINYLLMCALFESWVYPLVIMFTVPLATIGGFLGLRITHEYVPTQLLDVVTMLGFVILIGTVVNNAILIVSQSLNFMRGFGESELDKVQRLTPRMAIRESVRTRLRPVMMTTLTTLFGLLPLVIKPGSGSEIYRGLGSVVLGGLLVSTVFTLLVVPVVFSLVIDAKVALYQRLGWEVEAELRD